MALNNPGAMKAAANVMADAVIIATGEWGGRNVSGMVKCTCPGVRAACTAGIFRELRPPAFRDETLPVALNEPLSVHCASVAFMDWKATEAVRYFRLA